MASKIFRDPIYGYIRVPAEYQKNFIDTLIFQRLRRVEQTSMRALYPSAHHDRFIHSIGVYHLGSVAFEFIKKNSDKEILELLDENEWECLRISYELACLLHDCGHSPFSHTFEHYYVLGRGKEIGDRLIENCNEDVNFKLDYKSTSPADHELISSLVILEQFKSKIESLNGDAILVARMVLGCLYRKDTGLKYKVYNKIIQLLNGTVLDVDSLDYIQRDSWASGVKNVSIDYERLLGSLKMKLNSDGIPIIGFKKQAVSVLENISLGRNYLYKWIYAHHKVLYDQYLLTESLKIVDEQLTEEFCKKLFSIEAFTEPLSHDGNTFFLPTDDDVITILKRHHSSDSIIDEYLSRNHKLKALWKTKVEFSNLFDQIPNDGLIDIETSINTGAVDDILGGKNNFVCLPAKPKLKGFKSNHFFIFIDDQMIDASKLVDVEDQQHRYFFLYVKEEYLCNKDEIIKELKKLTA